MTNSADAYADCARTGARLASEMSRQVFDFWSTPLRTFAGEALAKPAVARSWYRRPATASVFDPSSWLMPTMGWPMGLGLAAPRPADPIVMMSALAAMTPVWQAFLRSPAANPWTAAWAWGGPGAAWGVASNPAADALAAMANPFAAYRSDGGHAVAQIRFAGEMIQAGLPYMLGLFGLPGVALFR